MADDKQGRDKKAHDAERRQREQELDAERARGDEPEPGKRLGEVDDALDALVYPTTSTAVVETYGDLTVETKGGEKTLEEVFPPVEAETFDSADDVRSRVLRLINRE